MDGSANNAPTILYFFNGDRGNIGYIHYLAETIPTTPPTYVYWDEVYRSVLAFDFTHANIPLNAIIKSIMLTIHIPNDYATTATFGKFPAGTTITEDIWGWNKFTNTGSTYYSNIPYNSTTPRNIPSSDPLYSDVVNSLNTGSIMAFIKSNTEDQFVPGNSGSNSFVNASITITWIVPITVTVQNAIGGSPSNVKIDGTEYPAPKTTTWEAGSSHTLLGWDQSIGGLVYPFLSWSKNGTAFPGNPISDSPTSNTTYQANYGPGVVITTIDQKLSNNVSTGQVGILESGIFAYYLAPTYKTFLPSNQTLKGTQDIVSGEKYNYWTVNDAIQSDITNHRSFQISGTASSFKSQLKPVVDGTSFAVTLEGTSVSDSVRFMDPWLIDYSDSYGTRNQGMSAPFKKVTTGGNPLGTGTSYKGVHLNQTTSVTYSVQAPSPKTIGGTTSYFLNWNVGSGANITQPSSATSPVVFTAANATVTANYKASFASNNTAAITNAGQKKFVRARYNNQNNNALYMVYESMGFIWLERSTDNGSSWHSMTNNLPISPSGSITPSIASVTGSGSEDYIAVTYALPSSGGSSVSIYLQVFVVKANGSIVTDLGTTLVNEYVALGGYYPPLYVCNPVVSINNGNRILVVWEGHNDANNNKNTFLYWLGIIEKDIIGVATGYSKLSLGRISGTSNTSSLPTMDATYGGYFHLSWRDASNGTIYYKRMYESSGSSIDQETTYPVSYGCGYIQNTKPSIISLGNSARISWVGFQSMEEQYMAKGMVEEGDYHTVFTATDGLYNFWSFGSDVITTSIGANKTSSYGPISEYIVSWASNNGSTNQYTRNSTLGGSIFTLSAGGTPISGNDLHVVPGTAFSNMLGVVLNTQQSPYRFKLSASIGTLGKQNDQQPINNGRQGIVWKENAQFYFMLGDISIDGTSIKFVEKPDTIIVDSKESLNTYLTTEPFSVSDASKFYHSVRYHIVDSASVSSLLDENGEITFTVQLIDDNSNTIIGEFDKVVFSKSNQFPYCNIGYQIDPKGIGSKTVRMRLVADANVDMNYSLVQRHSSDAAVNLGKGNNQRIQIGYKGSFVISDYALDQNYPNPFNPVTSISYALPQDGLVMLKIYDALGREVSTLVNEFKQTGRYIVSFDASMLSSGVYIYKLTSGKYSATKKMMLVK